MLNKDLVKSEMSNLVFMRDSVKDDKKEYRKICQKYKFLNSVLNILNIAVSDDFLKEQLRRVEKDIDRIFDSLVVPDSASGRVLSEIRRKHFKENNLSHFKNQQKHIKFCLKNKL